MAASELLSERVIDVTRHRNCLPIAVHLISVDVCSLLLASLFFHKYTILTLFNGAPADVSGLYTE
jgi:hypothetical protein